MKVFINIFLLTVCGSVFAQDRINPLIKGFGSCWDVPMAKFKADPSIQYKIVVEFREKNEDMRTMHPNFEHIGRMYNLHIYDGVPQKNLEVAVVIFGPASWAVINNEAYKAKFKTDNPNLAVFDEFRKAGVKLLVCGQSLMLQGIDPKLVDEKVEIASSRFTAVSTMQMKGFALFQMQ